MTRREFFTIAAGSGAVLFRRSEIDVPVNLVLDGEARWQPGQLKAFQSQLWPPAFRDFHGCGIHLRVATANGGIRRPPGREPVVTGLQRGVLNLAVTNRIPMMWDQGRAWSGMATLYRGHALCMIALDHAHGHQIPLLSVNTCTHEILHALMLDIFENRPPGVLGQAREIRIDWYATRLWLFGDGAAVRKSARLYLEKLAAIKMASG